MKKGFRKVCAALCSTALLCAATAVPASASTVSDVIAAAYAVGTVCARRHCNVRRRKLYLGTV